MRMRRLPSSKGLTVMRHDDFNVCLICYNENAVNICPSFRFEDITLVHERLSVVVRDRRAWKDAHNEFTFPFVHK